MPVFQFSFTLQDAYTRQSVKHGEVEALDFAGAQTAVAAFLTSLGNIVEAEILRYIVGQETVYTDTVVAGANLDEGITMTFLKADNKKAAVKVPSPANAVLNPDGTVNILHSDIVTWAAHYIGGPLYISDGELATELVKGTLDR